MGSLIHSVSPIAHVWELLFEDLKAAEVVVVIEINSMNVAMLLSCGSFEGFFGGVQNQTRQSYFRELSKRLVVVLRQRTARQRHQTLTLHPRLV